MSYRRKTDKTHKAIADVLRMLGLPFLDTSGAGGGLEDFVVGLPGCPIANCRAHDPRWVMLEAKSPRNKREEATESQFTPAQKEWRAKTKKLPRITATSAKDAETKLRELMGI
jgi:hypothetical protein